jgi:hypothetical protein
MTEPPLNWRQKCIQEFSLLPLPSEWTAKNNALSKLSISDDATWKRYYEFRKRLFPKKSGDSDEQDMDDEGYLLKRCQKAFREELRSLAREGCSLNWRSHTAQRIEDCSFEDMDELRTGIYRSYIFSPYALPQALTFKHYYHHRTRMSWVEFQCDWLFSMLRFDRSWPKTQPIYLADEEMELLCVNQLLDPPEWEGADWTAVEDIDVSNFTACTVQRFREWLFGCSFHSLEVMDNFSLLRLIFASCGTAGFSALYGDIGYTWRPNYDSEEERKLRSKGILTDDEDWPTLNWLEYQARLVTDSLRPQDMLYQPYDVREGKSDWGMNLLDNVDDEDDEDGMLDGLVVEGEKWDVIHAAPWILWERAEKRQKREDNL